MKKKLVLRCLLGAPVGFAVSMIITVIISLVIGDGNYYPIVPQMAENFGSEINAVVVQMILSFLYGASWAGASLIWQKEEWSLLRQTFTHLIVCSVFTFPVAYVCYWMPHNLTGVLSYFGIFFVIYFSIWISQYISIKSKIKKMNKKIAK
ncbi:MAG: DUF3021 domain-containing protein [bacterium]|nr:DUF3021 domain-containing protein [bacterium]MDY3862198.1 DUF3021 domain-containing protein [Ruminococcus sp.]